MRSVTICSLDTLLELLEKICSAMKRPNNKVEMGFEAPWSAKIGSKKCVAYISNVEELGDFWLAYSSHLDALKKKQKKKCSDEVVVTGIVFHNLMDSAQVSRSTFRRTLILIAFSPRQNVPGGGQGSKPPKDNESNVDARDSAQAKKTESAQKVQVGMFCKAHNRLCYQKFDGTCGAYTPDHVLEHATLLVSRLFLYFSHIVLTLFRRKESRMLSPTKSLRPCRPGCLTTSGRRGSHGLTPPTSKLSIRPALPSSL